MSSSSVSSALLRYPSPCPIIVAGDMAISKPKEQRLHTKRKADNCRPADRCAKKRATGTPGPTRTGSQSADGQSEEALFRIRHAAEFDDESVSNGASQTHVKKEQEEGEETATEMAQPAGVIPAGLPGNTLSPPAATTSRSANIV
jgi:hypothetical protein